MTIGVYPKLYFTNFKVVKLLLADKRIDPAANHNYAIRKAIECDHFNVAKILLADERIALI